MALTKTVTRVFPTANTVGFHLLLVDDGGTVIDRDFVAQHAVGQDVSNETRDKLGNSMQAAIDAYRRLKKIMDAGPYETARGQIENALDITKEISL